MTKTLLSLFIVLSLTACHERKGPEPKTSKEQLFTTSATNTITEVVSLKEKGTVENIKTKTDEKESLVKDIPIVEDNLPVLITPVVMEKEKQTFRGGKRSDGLDIKVIRTSHDETHTRLVFDTYESNAKATQSGSYIFTYDPSNKQISAVVNGYRKFSALSFNKARTFPSTSIVKNISMEKYLDDSGFKFSINLNKVASVNVFELKSPARIVVDILPN